MWSTYVVMKRLNTKTLSGYRRGMFSGRRPQDGESMTLAVRSLLQVSSHPFQPAPRSRQAQHKAQSRCQSWAQLEAIRDNQTCLGPALQVAKAGRSCLEGSGPGKSFGSKAGKRIFIQVATGKVAPEAWTKCQVQKRK